MKMSTRTVLVRYNAQSQGSPKNHILKCSTIEQSFSAKRQTKMLSCEVGREESETSAQCVDFVIGFARFTEYFILISALILGIKPQ